MSPDEAIARQLQLEEDGQGAAAAAGGPGALASSPTPQLSQIMAEQRAVQRSEQVSNGPGNLSRWRASSR